MYFPYLKGRQFELIALRELIEQNVLSNKIIPIIEPVKFTSAIIKTMHTFEKNNKKLGIIRNPYVGTFLTDMNKGKNKTLLKDFYEILNCESVISSILINEKTPEYLRMLHSKGVRNDKLICICQNRDSIPIYEELFSNGPTLYNLIPDDTIFRRRIRNNRVLLEDKFSKQKRNIDYADIDEPFSDDHIYSYEDGYIGFSDYSIVGDEYSESGFAPYAIAIHIVYFDKENSLRIRHFVSDTNDDITDPANKFYEAVGKLVKWNHTRSKPLDTIGIKAFEQMYNNEIYPGLGVVKKLSIMHHLELMGSFLDRRELI